MDSCSQTIIFVTQPQKYWHSKKKIHSQSTLLLTLYSTDTGKGQPLFQNNVSTLWHGLQKMLETYIISLISMLTWLRQPADFSCAVSCCETPILLHPKGVLLDSNDWEGHWNCCHCYVLETSLDHFSLRHSTLLCGHKGMHRVKNAQIDYFKQAFTWWLISINRPKVWQKSSTTPLNHLHKPGLLTKVESCIITLLPNNCLIG